MNATRVPKKQQSDFKRVLPWCLLLWSFVLPQGCYSFCSNGLKKSQQVKFESSSWKEAPKVSDSYHHFPIRGTSHDVITEEVVNGKKQPESPPTTQEEKDNVSYMTADEHEEELINGEKLLIDGERTFVDDTLEKVNLTNANIRKKDLMPDAPPLTFSKYLTMQQKRVVITFRYSDLPHLRPYYLTFASKIKQRHSDLIIEKRVLPVVDGSPNSLFEVLVDGKIVIGGGKSRERHVPGGRVDVQNTQSVFVSMDQLGLAISRARKKRRPSTLYGGHNGEDNPEMKRERRTFIR